MKKAPNNPGLFSFLVVVACFERNADHFDVRSPFLPQGHLAEVVEPSGAVIPALELGLYFFDQVEVGQTLSPVGCRGDAGGVTPEVPADPKCDHDLLVQVGSLIFGSAWNLDGH